VNCAELPAQGRSNEAPSRAQYDPAVPTRSAVAAALACAAALGACSSDAHPPPAACTDGPGPLRRALASAPAKVTLDGAPLSDCFTKGSDADDIQRVGSAWVSVAADLARAARRRPEGPAALRLGYLVGAARRGAGNSPGLHMDLVRRVEQEARPFEDDSSALRAGLRAGERVG
jgi:hypothetical protein